jgi:pimeloyl-ACP methyl ester carboxylesterase
MISTPDKMEKTSIEFQISENFFIRGDAFGDKKNPTVILLHGGGQTRHSWGETAFDFAKNGWYAIALDARGHGDSSWSGNGSYLYNDLANDLYEVIKQLNSKPALIGASMGGISSLLLAGEAENELATAVVLVDIAPKTEQKGIERIFAFMSAHTEGFESLEAAAEAVAKYLPNREKPKDNSRLEKNLRLKPDGRYYWHWDPAMLENWRKITPDIQNQLEERLYTAAKNLKVPTLIVRGGISDVVSEKVMAEFLDIVPNVESVTVSGAGHMVAGDSNHAFTKAVLTFLEKHKTSFIN